MARLNRHLLNRNGVWYISWVFKGQRHSVSTAIPVGTGAEQKRANLVVARAARDRYQSEVRRSRGRDPEGLWRELLRSLDELDAQVQADLRRRWADELLAAAGRRVPIAEAWDLWERDPQRGMAGAVTLGQYRSQWRRFARWADAAGLQVLQDLTAARAREYAAELWSDGIAPGTYNAHVSFLRGVWSVLSVPCGLRDNPWAGVRRVAGEQEGRREFDEQQLRAICEKAQGSWRAMVALGLYTALRLGDVACLAWDSLDLDAGLLRLVPSKTKRKGARAVVEVPLHAGLVEMLAARRSVVGGEWVFPDERETYLADRSALARQFTEFLRETCGIETREAAGAQRSRAIVRYGFHSLRHSFVSICRRAGVPEMVVMEMVGHGSPAMTRLYTHGTRESRAAAISSLPALPAALN